MRSCTDIKPICSGLQACLVQGNRPWPIWLRLPCTNKAYLPISYGDNIRQGINKDLSFAHEDRTENIRRIAEISNLMLNAGLITLAAFVSPYIKDREEVQQIVGTDNFIEIFVNTSLEECERRDVKGLYKKARSGEIKNMTGISAPYEAPVNPDLEVITDGQSIEESVEIIINFINKKLKPST